MYLGAISFPIYILHGPIGQIFYKKVVAMKLFGTVMVGKTWQGGYCEQALDRR